MALKKELAAVCLHPIDELTPFVVETDASELALAGTMYQNKRRVDFFSRTFNESERWLPSVEKKALTIVECIRKWWHLLSTNHFTLITDQKSMAYLFTIKHMNKIKKTVKFTRWRLELSTN